MCGSCRDVAGAAKKCQEITMDRKVKIIELEFGEKMVDISHVWNTNHTTISTILKIVEMWTVSKMSTVILKKRGKVMEEMEKLLCVWMQHQCQHRVLLSLMLMQWKWSVSQSWPTLGDLMDPMEPHQASLSMEFCRQQFWSVLPFPSPGDLSNPGTEPGSPTSQADSLSSEWPGKPESLYENLKKQHRKESEGVSFHASHGWFHWVMTRANIKWVVRPQVHIP